MDFLRPVKYSNSFGQVSSQSTRTPPVSTSSTICRDLLRIRVCISTSAGAPKLFPIGKFIKRLLGGLTCSVKSLPVDRQTVEIPASSTTRHTKPTVWWSRGQAGAAIRISTPSSLSFSTNSGADSLSTLLRL